MWWRQRRSDEDFDREIQAHLALETDRLVGEGLPPEEARAAARRRFGNVLAHKERFYEAHRTLWWDGTRQDLRYAYRTLRKTPGFTITAILILALGIGSTTTVFSVINAILLQPLPYPEAHQIVSIGRHQPEGLSLSHDGRTVAFLREHSQAFAAIAAVRGSPGVNLVSGYGTAYVSDLRVSAGYFAVLGIQPALGRAFVRDDEAPPATVILSHGLWSAHFGSDPEILGQTVRLGSLPFTVIGVMPAEFRSFHRAEAWTPFRPPEGDDRNYQVIARLRPDATIARAATELEALGTTLREEHPTALRDTERLSAEPFQDTLSAGSVPLLGLLAGASVMVLLIVCANTAGLQLARGAARRRELAIRAALGGRRGRLLRQLLTESLLLALAGGTLGVLLLHWGVQGIVALRPATAMWEVQIDGVVLTVALVLSLGTGLLFGLFPGLQSTRENGGARLINSSRTATSAHASWMRGFLVLAQVGFCTLLLVGAGLFIRTFVTLRSVDLGFDPEGVLTAGASLQGPRYQEPGVVRTLYERTLSELALVPGVEAVAVVNNLPVERGLNLPIRIPGLDTPGSVTSVDWRYVTPAYFRVMGIPVASGRGFDDRDGVTGRPVTLVNEAFVRQFGLDRGAQIQLAPLAPQLADAPREIVGVVGDVRTRGLAQIRPTMFVPLAQVPPSVLGLVHDFLPMRWVLRTRGDIPTVTTTVEEVIRSADRSLPISAFRSMNEVIGASLTEQRFQMVLVTLFAVVALSLAAAGLYGLVAYAVAQQTREIGIRLALGASSRRVVTALVWRGLVLAVAGSVVGLGAAILLARLLTGFFFGVQPPDPWALAGVVSVLTATSLIATYVPARRATHIDPATTLRAD